MYRNCLLVSVDEKYISEIEGLLIDSTYEPEEYATIEGIVMSVPSVVEDEGWRNLVSCDVRVGEKVWFNYNAIFDYVVRREGETPVYKNLIQWEGKEYWRVDIVDVFCYERDGVKYVHGNRLILKGQEGVEGVTSGGLSLLGVDDMDSLGELLVKPIDCDVVNVGDIVAFEKEYAIRYFLFGIKCIVVFLSRVVGKKID